MANRKELHDLLLAQMPEGATHEACSLCTTEQPEGGTQVGKTYTEDELQTAVAEATAELASELKALKDAAAESELEAAVSAAKAEAAAEIEELKAKLDTAVLAAQAARAEFDQFKADLEEIEETARQEVELTARRDERLAAAKEFGFDDEYLAENADRFVAMGDEEWASRLADWSAVARKTETAAAADRIPSKTALTAAREDTNTNSGMDAIRGAMRGVLVGRDPRTL
jgi:DNA repair exonuclease SbcCD ATPase subunit